MIKFKIFEPKADETKLDIILKKLSDTADTLKVRCKELVKNASAKIQKLDENVKKEVIMPLTRFIKRKQKEAELKKANEAFISDVAVARSILGAWIRLVEIRHNLHLFTRPFDDNWVVAVAGRLSDRNVVFQVPRIPNPNAEVSISSLPICFNQAKDDLLYRYGIEHINLGKEFNFLCEKLDFLQVDYKKYVDLYDKYIIEGNPRFPLIENKIYEIKREFDEITQKKEEMDRLCNELDRKIVFLQTVRFDVIGVKNDRTHKGFVRILVQL